MTHGEKNKERPKLQFTILSFASEVNLRAIWTILYFSGHGIVMYYSAALARNFDFLVRAAAKKLYFRGYCPEKSFFKYFLYILRHLKSFEREKKIAARGIFFQCRQEYNFYIIFLICLFFRNYIFENILEMPFFFAFIKFAKLVFQAFFLLKYSG